VTAAAAGAPGELLKAAGWMAVALASFVLLAVSARELLDTMSAFQILFLRTVIGLGLIVGFGLLTRQTFHRTARLRLHLVRNVFHYAGQVCWVIAIGLLPLATVFALEFTTPIWAAILAWLTLGERLDRGRLLATLLGFAGILIILRPGVLPLDMRVLVPVAAALGFSVQLTATKALTRTDSTLTIMFYMMLSQLVLGALPAAWTWSGLAAGDWPWILGVGVTGLTAHVGVTRAFRHADLTLVLPMDFLRLPLVALVGALVYAEPFDPLVLAGAGLIVVGNYQSLRRGRGR
jgi:drug/metabolite transporter (DMT)-like permease